MCLTNAGRTNPINPLRPNPRNINILLNPTPLHPILFKSNSSSTSKTVQPTYVNRHTFPITTRIQATEKCPAVQCLRNTSIPINTILVQLSPNSSSSLTKNRLPPASQLYNTQSLSSTTFRQGYHPRAQTATEVQASTRRQRNNAISLDSNGKSRREHPSKWTELVPGELRLF